MRIDNLPILLYLAAIPLVSYGTVAGVAPVTWLGFAAVVAGGLIVAIRRFTGQTDDNEEPTENGDQS